MTPTAAIAVVTPTLEAPAAGSGWYAVCTRPRHEKKVAQQLDERGVENFLPLYHSVRRWKDRRKQLDLVLFPGYIFVNLELSRRLQVLQLAGVLRFVSFNGLPAALRGEDLEALRNGLAQNLHPEYHPYLTAGRRVMVTGGALSGAHGVLVRRKNKYRLVISLSAIMRSVSLEIDEADVAPVF